MNVAIRGLKLDFGLDLCSMDMSPYNLFLGNFVCVFSP